MDQATGQTENRYLAEKLDEVADLLRQQNASSFRVQAYRAAADHIAQSPAPIRDVFDASGTEGLAELPTIGPSIAQALGELLETGSLTLLDRLRGEMDPEQLFQTVPTIGPAIARQLHRELHLETLEALEAAAVDGRLATLKGIGPRRVRSIELALADMLARRRPRRAGAVAPYMPPIGILLEIDSVYRKKAQAGQLATISPRRFNPNGDVRIPILHAERAPWRFTALYSNSPNAHRFGRFGDWVIIFFEQDGQAEDQCTVVTEHKGVLDGKRVVRGHERACLAHYERVGLAD